MRQFIFTLQALYDMQEKIEKQYKMQLAVIESEIAKHTREMDALNSSFDKVQSEYCGVLTGGVAAVRIHNYGHFFEKLRAVMLLHQGKINKLENEKEKCLEKLVHVRKEKMVLEKLREEQFAEYISERKKQQAKLMDDFVSYKTNVS